MGILHCGAKPPAFCLLCVAFRRTSSSVAMPMPWRRQCCTPCFWPIPSPASTSPRNSGRTRQKLVKQYGVFQHFPSASNADFHATILDKMASLASEMGPAQDLVIRISFWTSGICPEFVDTSHWKLNLGGGDVAWHLRNFCFGHGGDIRCFDSSMMFHLYMDMLT